LLRRSRSAKMTLLTVAVMLADLGWFFLSRSDFSMRNYISRRNFSKNGIIQLELFGLI
jgi:hypothetical protein